MNVAAPVGLHVSSCGFEGLGLRNCLAGLLDVFSLIRLKVLVLESCHGGRVVRNARFRGLNFS